ncbi:MAG: hypothetical protein GX826_14390, partial [Gammaproteobacteria bacterium]|nr:hypothetical protein [Gammaproteobacteria bacterium]
MTPTPTTGADARGNFMSRALDAIERIGNRLPDPAMLFLLLMLLVWALSWA